MKDTPEDWSQLGFMIFASHAISAAATFEVMEG